jgi:hypothetical protein
MLPSQPIINLLVNVVRGEAVSRLDRFFEPIAPAINPI